MLKIIPLSEGAFTVDRTKKFVPFDVANDDLQERNKGSLLVEIQPFVVITENDIILLDTGLGHTDSSGQLQIHKNLANAGISASDITKVLLSHLHKDHSGGIASPDKKSVAFENATYYVNKEEWEFGIEKKSSSYHPEDFLVLQQYPNVVFTEGNGVLDDTIHYQFTGAHSPFHQAFEIVENDRVVFYGGDVASQFQQMKNRFKAKYDFDGAAAMELRQQWWQQGEQEKWTFLFYHDIKTPIYQFE